MGEALERTRPSALVLIAAFVGREARLRKRHVGTLVSGLNLSVRRIARNSPCR